MAYDIPAGEQWGFPEEKTRLRKCTVTGKYGDCIRACIATMIDRDDVPHVFDGRNAEESWTELRKYLANQGKKLALFIVLDPFDDDIARFNPDIEYMLMCRTSAGDHAVLCKNGAISHDPAWVKREILGEHSCGAYIAGVICV